MLTIENNQKFTQQAKLVIKTEIKFYKRVCPVQQQLQASAERPDDSLNFLRVNVFQVQKVGEYGQGKWSCLSRKPIKVCMQNWQKETDNRENFISFF